jgi:hypothetical protein
VRPDLTHAGSAQQQVGMSLGTVLVYLNLRELQQTGEESAGRLISRESELRFLPAVDPSVTGDLIKCARLMHDPPTFRVRGGAGATG